MSATTARNPRSPGASGSRYRSKATSAESDRSAVQSGYNMDDNVFILNQIEVNQDILCITYTETYDFLAAGVSDGTVRLYKANTGENTVTLRDAETVQNPAPTTAIKHRPVHKGHPITHTLTATYANGYVKCWHYPSSQCLYTIREKRQTLGLSYHPQLSKFVTVGDDGNLHLYDEETRTQERIFRASDSPEVMDGHRSRVFAACFNPKSAHELISSGWDDTIQFWDIRQPHATRHISGVHMCGDGLDISRNGKEILSCAWQRKDAIQLWDYDSGRLIVTLEPDSYSSLLYSGKYINNFFFACGGTDVNMFRIVDLRSHSTTGAIRHLHAGVYGVDVGPLDAKYAKRTKVSHLTHLPKIAFCAGKIIFEVDVQPG